MKKIILYLSMLIILTYSAYAFAGGTGTSGNPWQITNCTDLQAVQNNLTASYILNNDINCSATSTWNWDGTRYRGFDPIGVFSSGYFTGNLDGNDYTIYNLYINRPSENAIGLFADVRNGAIIKDLHLKNVNIIGLDNVGGIVGYFNAGTSSAPKITCCSVDGLIKPTGSSDNIGGIAGQMGGGTYRPIIEKSWSSVFINASTSGATTIGLLVGHLSAGNITNSYANGTLRTTSTTNPGYAGGITGRISGVNGKIINSYFAGYISSSWFSKGCIAGANSGTVTGTYYNNQTCTIGGTAGTPKTTAQMKKQATFVGWDFTNIWAIIEDTTYPYLKACCMPELGLLCNDSIDNDCDTFIDLNDPDCCDPVPEICNDNIDNDCDGFIDGLDSDCNAVPEFKSKGMIATVLLLAIAGLLYLYVRKK